MKETEGLGCSTFGTSGITRLDGGDSGHGGAESLCHGSESGGMVGVD